jgi:hypothetical protein
MGRLSPAQARALMRWRRRAAAPRRRSGACLPRRTRVGGACADLRGGELARVSPARIQHGVRYTRWRRACCSTAQRVAARRTCCNTARALQHGARIATASTPPCNALHCVSHGRSYPKGLSFMLAAMSRCVRKPALAVARRLRRRGLWRSGYSGYSHRATLSTHTGLLWVLAQGYSGYSHRATLRTHTGVACTHRGRVHTQRQRKGCIGAAAQRRGTHSTAGYSAAQRPRHCRVLVGTHSTVGYRWHCRVLVGTHGRWIYDADPLAHLKFEQPLGELKRRIAESGSSYFQAKIGPTPATSAPELGAPPPHRRRDWAHPRHIGAGTGRTPATVLRHRDSDRSGTGPHCQRALLTAADGLRCAGLCTAVNGCRSCCAIL